MKTGRDPAVEVIDGKVNCLSLENIVSYTAGC